MRVLEKIGDFALRYPALQVGLLLGGAVIAAAQGAYVPAAIQGCCAAFMACTVKRWF